MTGQRGFVLSSLAAFVAVCAALLVATHFAMGYIVRTSIGEHASQAASDFTDYAKDILPSIAEEAKEGVDTPWQVGILKGRMQGSDIVALKLFDDQGAFLLSVQRTGLGYSREGDVDPEARETAAKGVARHEVHYPDEGADDPDTRPIFIETYVPVTMDDGAVYVIEAYIDVTSLAHNLEQRLDFYAVLFALGGLAAYSLPALLLAWKTRQLRRRDHEMISMSRRDALTGLWNRSAAARAFPDIVPRHEGEKVTLFYMDVDRFKSINDTMGHAAGDRILRQLGRTLDEVAGPGDIAARFGGDEFILVRRHPPGECDVDVARRILATVGAPLDLFGQRVRPEISLGGYVLRPGDGFDESLRAADLALYEAKSQGRARYVRHSKQLMRRKERRNEVEKRIRAAIATNAFYMEYQPIYCGRAERLIGFEALLRLQGADAGPIPPDEFIPVAEAAGLIADVGAIALRQALDVAAGWPDDIFIAVNVSALQFGAGTFPALVEAELARVGMPAHRLELELTESVFLSESGANSIELAELKSLGVSLALDDFGTGYSSLAYLWRFPFDKLKIDRAFLEGFDYDREKYARFISTVVLLGQRMGMIVTAEGLETTDQLAMLEQMGVEGYQGYLLGRPLPEAVATDYAHRRPPPALMVLDEVPPEEVRGAG